MTRSELILNALLTGKPLPLSDIRRMVSEASGKEVRLGDISSLMAKLINPRQYKIAHFIKRNKTPQGYEYSLVPEILNLAPEEVYGLTRKTRKGRFTLEMAVEKIPELSKYLKKMGKAVGKKPAAVKKPATKKASAGKKTSVKKTKAVKKKPKAKAGKSKITKVKGKPGRKPAPKPPEPVIQKANIEDLVNGFLHELDKMGGMRVNYYLTVSMEK
jgi:hypothetical protein